MGLRVGRGNGPTEQLPEQHGLLLLVLARRRLADIDAGLPDGECGWLELGDLGPNDDLRPLNIWVFRIRHLFAELGVVDSVGIIEWREPRRAFRIGTPRIEIHLVGDRGEASS